MDVEHFYWNEVSALWRAFGLGAPASWNGPVDLRVLRNHGAERERAERGPARPFPFLRLVRPPWWKFWAR